MLLRRHWPDTLIAFIIFTLCLVVYNATLTPSLSYKSPDGNELATVCTVLGLAHSTGYPLYTWLGKLFTIIPIGDVAHRVNLMSAVLGAGGVVLLYAILRLLTSDLRQATASRLASAFTALLFALSLTFWSQTGIAEVYAPNVFMFTLTLLLLLVWARVEEHNRQSRPQGQTRWRKLIPAILRPKIETVILSQSKDDGFAEGTSLYTPHPSTRSGCLAYFSDDGSAPKLISQLIPSWKSLLLLFAFGLCYGLSMGTHLSNLGFAPAFALFMLLVSWRTALNPLGIASAGSAFFLGLLQFLWLPFKASTLTDRAMRANAPTTLRGIYSYTLGAFPQFKFAFPLGAIPDRIVIYLGLLQQQFSIVGIALGVLGMWTLLWRKPKRFFLVVGMYLVHVWFFIQYRVFDLDVFFIPAHLLYAVFIGFGITWLIERLFRPAKGYLLRRAALAAALVLAMMLPVAYEMRTNWESNDYSDDTAINDFYESAFDMLPQDAALLGRSGVFGYDMFYYRLAYDVRPDVAMPHLPDANPRPEELAGREVYTTMRLDNPQAGRGPWALPRDIVGEVWYVPVLFGNPGQSGIGLQQLILYHVTAEPPELVVQDAGPQIEIGAEAAGWVLVGYDLESTEVRAGDALHLTLYWRAGQSPQGVLLSTMIEDRPLETHEPGMGNLPRYRQEFHPPRDGILVEEYRVVMPRTIEPGTATLSIGMGHPLRRLGSEAGWEAVLDLGQITILPTE